MLLFFHLSFSHFQSQAEMSSNRRRASLSPSERRRRSKSRSSSRSHSKTNADEKKIRRVQSSLQPATNDDQQIKTIKRSKSSSNLRTNKEKNSSKKRKSTTKLSKFSSESDLKEKIQPNNAERQDLTARGLSVVPSEVTDRKSTKQKNKTEVSKFFFSSKIFSRAITSFNFSE